MVIESERAFEKSARTNSRVVDAREDGLTFGFEPFGGREFGQRAEVVLGLLQPRIASRALGCNNHSGVDGVSSRIGRALENREQNVSIGSSRRFLGSWFVLRCLLRRIRLVHVFCSIDPAVRDFETESEDWIAIHLFVGARL